MAIEKSIEFYAPHISSALNTHTDRLTGYNGLISGATVLSYTATSVTLGPCDILQDGVVIRQSSQTTLTVPDYSSEERPIYIVASSPDAKDTSGLTITVHEGVSDIGESSVVIAIRASNQWIDVAKISLEHILKRELTLAAETFPGRIRDAKIDFSTSYGTNQGIRLGSGVVSEPSGHRRALPVDSSVGAGYNREIDIKRIDPDFNAQDYLILQNKKDAHNIRADVLLARGETFSTSLTPKTAATNPTISSTGTETLGSAGYNADGQAVVCWGDGTSLHLSRRDHDTSRAQNASDTLTASGNVQDTMVAVPPNIQSGDRIYGVFSDGTNINIFRTTADGAALDTAIVLTAFANTGQKPQIVIDGNLKAHIVFQHDEGGSGNNNQVYYVKYNLDDSVWGTISAIEVEARFARGSNSGQNDTDPHLGIDSDGHIHIAFVRATSPNVIGDIVYLVIDDTGATVTAEQTVSADVNDGEGVALSTSSNNDMPRVAVSSYGTVYVGFIRREVSTEPDPCVFEPTLEARTGFKSVRLDEPKTPPAPYVHIVDIPAWDIFCDELGRLSASVSGEGSLVPWPQSNQVFYYKFNSVLVSDGVNIAPDGLNFYNSGNTQNGIVDFIGFSTPFSANASFDRDGSVHLVTLESTGLNHYRHSSQAYRGGTWGSDTGKFSEFNSVVGEVGLPHGASDTVDGDYKVTTTFNAISGDPIKTVGNNGSYGGFYGIEQAINSLRGEGGRVYVRPGFYNIYHRIFLQPGIELISEGNVVLNFWTDSGDPGIYVTGDDGLTASTIDATNHQFKFDYVPTGIHPVKGDVIFLCDYSSIPPAISYPNLYGPYFISRVIDRNGTFVLDQDISSVITSLGLSYPAIYMPSGVRMQGFTLIDNRPNDTEPLVKFAHAYKPVMKNVHIESSRTGAAYYYIESKGCFGALYKNVTTNNQDGSHSTNAIDIDGLNYAAENFPIIEGCRFLNGHSRIAYSDTVYRPRITGSVAAEWRIDEANGPYLSGSPTFVDNEGSVVQGNMDSGATIGDGVTHWMNTVEARKVHADSIGYAVRGRTSDNNSEAVQGIITGGTGGHGVHGEADVTDGQGVHGESSGQDGHGVHGEASHEDSMGVYGETTAAIVDNLPVSNNAGVYGKGNAGEGVFGISSGVGNNHAGVKGYSDGGNCCGILGISSDYYAIRGYSANNQGIRGESTNGEGVRGESTNGDGVQGDSSGQWGVLGETSAAGYAGVGGNSFALSAQKEIIIPVLLANGIATKNATGGVPDWRWGCDLSGNGSWIVDVPTNTPPDALVFDVAVPQLSSINEVFTHVINNSGDGILYCNVFRITNDKTAATSPSSLQLTSGPESLAAGANIVPIVSPNGSNILSYPLVSGSDAEFIRIVFWTDSFTTGSWQIDSIDVRVFTKAASFVEGVDSV